jgi:hypothetical protein
VGACGEHANWQGVGQHWPKLKTKSPGSLYQQPGGAGLHLATGQNESSGEHGVPGAGVVVVVVVITLQASQSLQPSPNTCHPRQGSLDGFRAQ